EEPPPTHLVPPPLDRHHLTQRLRIPRVIRPAPPLMPGVDQSAPARRHLPPVLRVDVPDRRRELVLRPPHRPHLHRPVHLPLPQHASTHRPRPLHSRRPHVRRPRLPLRRRQRKRLGEMLHRPPHRVSTLFTPVTAPQALPVD